MKQVGIIKEIWRYPVKGMAGEQLELCAIGPHGFEGDRTWALRDSLRQEIQSCKFRPALLQCTARRRGDAGDPGVDITFPDGHVVPSEDPRIHTQLSQLVGHESTLETLQPIEHQDFYRRYKPDPHSWLEELKATFTREPGEPLPDFTDLPQQAQDFVTVPGSFFLVTPFHIITTATLQRLQQALPSADWDVRRFRPNIVIETNNDLTGLVEQQWIEKQMVVGNTAINCAATAPRCGAVTRAQDGLGVDKAILRAIVNKADQNLGIYGSIADTGIVRVGDAVSIR